MTWVAGVDGCRAGWVVVLLEIRRSRPRAFDVLVCRRWDEVLTLRHRPTIIAVDIPIGLLDQPEPGGRCCDQAARRLLGERAGSVFSPPARAHLRATTYQQVRFKGLSIQAFGILPKIREVDRVMTPGVQSVVHEAHPELAFRALTGQPMRHNKKSPIGRLERLGALKRWFPQVPAEFHASLRRFKRRNVAPDDLLDAYALAWTGSRLLHKRATCLPPHPSRDRRGLRMEIWY